VTELVGRAPPPVQKRRRLSLRQLERKESAVFQEYWIANRNQRSALVPPPVSAIDKAKSVAPATRFERFCLRVVFLEFALLTHLLSPPWVWLGCGWLSGYRVPFGEW